MHDLFAEFTAILRPRPSLVYPAYLAFKAKQALRALVGDTDGIVTEVNDVESLGNSRYRIPVTDLNGTRYRVTVEVVS